MKITMIVNFNPQPNFIKTSPIQSRQYPNLAPLKQDTVSFGCKKFVRPKDLMDLKNKEIIQVCINALEKEQTIGQGTEAIVYKIPDYAMQYCLRRDKKTVPNTNKLKLDFNLDEYDKANFVIAKLGEGLTLLKYVPGIPLKIITKSDTESGIKVKHALQELVANNFPIESFEKTISLIEESRSKGIVFDRKGENLLVDAISQEMTPIDYSRQFNDIEYNPISYIYHALDVDNTEHAAKVLKKLCIAYAERLKTVSKEELNLDVLDRNFYHRGFIFDPFNQFPDKEALEAVRAKLFDELLEQKFTAAPDEFEWLVECYKDFVEEKLSISNRSRFPMSWDFDD